MKVALAVLALLAVAVTGAAYWWFRAPAHGIALAGAFKVMVVPKGEVVPVEAPSVDAGLPEDVDAGVVAPSEESDAGESLDAGELGMNDDQPVDPDAAKAVIGVKVDDKFGGHLLFLLAAGSKALQPVAVQDTEEKANELERLLENRSFHALLGSDGGARESGITATRIENLMDHEYWVAAADMDGELAASDPEITAQSVNSEKVNPCPEKNGHGYSCTAGPVKTWRLLRGGQPIGDLRTSSYEESQEGTEEGGGMNGSTFLIEWKADGAQWQTLETLADNAGC